MRHDGVEPLRLEVPDGDVVALVEQAAGHRLAHDADADEADAGLGHGRFSLVQTRVPPSAMITEAVMNEASSEASHRIGQATSRGSAQRRWML